MIETSIRSVLTADRVHVINRAQLLNPDYSIKKST